MEKLLKLVSLLISIIQNVYVYQGSDLSGASSIIQ